MRIARYVGFWLSCVLTASVAPSALRAQDVGEWVPFPGYAKVIADDGFGDNLWSVLKGDGDQPVFRFNYEIYDWEQVGGGVAVGVTVPFADSGEGIAWVWNQAGEIWSWSDEAGWNEEGGCARQVAFGFKNDVWHIGCAQDSKGTSGIWRRKWNETEWKKMPSNAKQIGRSDNVMMMIDEVNMPWFWHENQQKWIKATEPNGGWAGANLRGSDFIQLYTNDLTTLFHLIVTEKHWVYARPSTPNWRIVWFTGRYAVNSGGQVFLWDRPHVPIQ